MKQKVLNQTKALEAKGIKSYKGTDIVMVGNGSTLSISSIPTFAIQHTSLMLKNTLIVPYI